MVIIISNVESGTEVRGKVKDVPYKRLFDWSFNINHIKSTKLSCSTPLREVGFDVTVISPSTLTTFKRMLAHIKLVFRFLRREKGRSLRVIVPTLTSTSSLEFNYHPNHKCMTMISQMQER